MLLLGVGTVVHMRRSRVTLGHLLPGSFLCSTFSGPAALTASGQVSCLCPLSHSQHCRYKLMLLAWAPGVKCKLPHFGASARSHWDISPAPPLLYIYSWLSYICRAEFLHGNFPTLTENPIRCYTLDSKCLSKEHVGKISIRKWNL